MVDVIPHLEANLAPDDCQVEQQISLKNFKTVVNHKKLEIFLKLLFPRWFDTGLDLVYCLFFLKVY